jgi:hypothetical protein
VVDRVVWLDRDGARVNGGRDVPDRSSVALGVRDMRRMRGARAPKGNEKSCAKGAGEHGWLSHEDLTRTEN